MPEGFLRSLHRRSVRARQALLGSARRRYKRNSDSFIQQTSDKEGDPSDTPASQSIVTLRNEEHSTSIIKTLLDGEEKVSVTKLCCPPPDILINVQMNNDLSRTTANYIEELPRVIVSPDKRCSDCDTKTPEKQHVFLTPASKPPQRGTRTFDDAVVHSEALDTATPITEHRSDSETPTRGFLFRSKSVKLPQSSAGETSRCDVTSITTSFLRRSIRRRSVLHFNTPRARQAEGTATNGEGVNETPGCRDVSLPPALLCGALLKRSSSALSRDARTRKFAALHDDGCLRYYSSRQDYAAGARGKEVWLRCAAVRVPRVLRARSRASLAASSSLPTSGYATPSRGSWYGKDEVELTAFHERRDSPASRSSMTSSREHGGLRSLASDEDASDGGLALQFEVVSFDGRAWRFEAASRAERDAWVSAIERQILRTLQLGPRDAVSTVAAREGGGDALSLRNVPGNDVCADCGTPEPAWASLNLGVVTCIACSGAHRGLGSHVSRVRSLELDHWTRVQVSALRLVGNTLANSVWESDVRGHAKPSPYSTVEEKRSWVRAKYAERQFLTQRAPSSALQLQSAVRDRDMTSIVTEVAQAPGTSPALQALLILALEERDEALAQFLEWNGAKQTVAEVHQQERDSKEISSLVELIKSCGCSNLI